MSLGGEFTSPEAVRANLSQRQIDEWREYYARNPFGEYRDDLRNAQLCLVNYKSAGGKGRKTLQDFMLKFKKKSRQKRMTREQLERELTAFKELKKNGSKGSR